jgi:hypothetical protein
MPPSAYHGRNLLADMMSAFGGAADMVAKPDTLGYKPIMLQLSMTKLDPSPEPVADLASDGR